MNRRFVNDRTLQSTARFIEIARQHGLPVATLAIAWTLTHDFVGSTIIGATDVGQLADTLAAADTTLGAELIEACTNVTRDIRYPLG
jgi:aryl-alcohol dehydrogenase-like predicted oxidoreductase